MQDIHIPIVLSEGSRIPVLAKPGDAGLDLFAKEDFSIFPGELKKIDTGIRMAVPEGFEAQVRPKSGLALKARITVLNTPGTVDSGYRGDIGVILWRTLGLEEIKILIQHGIADALRQYANGGTLDSFTFEAKKYLEPYTFKKGDKIAQLVFAQYVTPKFTIVDTLPESERGTGGFGSSGR